MVQRIISLCTLWVFVTFCPQSASAFCGFYVAGGESSLFNDATQVAIMRHGIRTVLSMQNNYAGPTEEFAMVVPVPVVLQQENVKTLNEELFAKIDRLSAPRLVEYWEHDPCEPIWMEDGPVATTDFEGGTGGGEVTVEAEFTVGEYDIVILSTEDALGLENWLTANNYNIPDGAAEHFSPYVTSEHYFFVAKVNPDEVTFVEGKAVLSPLRFDYDWETFALPVKLGLINSQGTQDIIVYILANDQRYEVANAPNVTIPTNLEVSEDVKNDFGSFYTDLFLETINQNPGAVITEYSWDASTCDPCPGPTLDQEDYLTLGADVMNLSDGSGSWVLTRLHARYTSDQLGDDLVFSAVDPIVGGRQVYNGENQLEEGAQPSTYNNFQGRYIIYNPWEGETICEDPIFDRWGGPPGGGGQSPTPLAAVSPNTSGENVAQDTTSGNCASSGLDCGQGTCVDVNDAATCVCDTGYTGTTCNTCDAGYQDNDNNNICLANCITLALDCGHGACIDSTGTAECQCDTGYTGSDCNTCTTGYQDNNTDGSCLPTCATSNFNCGTGTCVDTSGTAICDCGIGNSGDSCSVCNAGYQDNNDDGVCTADCTTAALDCGHGACIDTSGNALCACTTGYTGTACDTCAAGYQDNNSDDTCNPNCVTAALDCGQGVCNDASGAALCDCQTGYAGDACDTCDTGYQDNNNDDSCHPNCATAALDCGQGACDDASGAALCVCQTGYAGTACDTCEEGYQDNDDDGICSPNCTTAALDCGFGHCDDASGTVSCICQTGYAGDNCNACEEGFQLNETDNTCSLEEEIPSTNLLDENTDTAQQFSGACACHESGHNKSNPLWGFFLLGLALTGGRRRQ